MKIPDVDNVIEISPGNITINFKAYAKLTEVRVQQLARMFLKANNPKAADDAVKQAKELFK